jgi:tRNA threonylcarbamoyladenosine biosynthesis protein TsaB
MLILAIDTTGEAGGAAIYQDEECLASVAHEGAARGYSVSLFQMVERLTTEISRKPSPPLRGLADIELYAVANGPGSFTGIRVGVAAVQGWARAFGKPVKGISVLEAMVDTSRPETDRVVPLLNAYRGEFYAGVFRRIGNNRYVAADGGVALKQEAVREFAAEQLRIVPVLSCIVRARDHAAVSLRPQLPAGIEWRCVEGTLLPAIARLGHRAALEGRIDSPTQLDAYYIRQTDAELSLKE